MAYTDIDKPSDYFESKIWTGNGSSQNISLDFAPNWVWIKQRSGTRYHNLQDTIRGTGLQLFSNATSADNSDSTNITAFNSDGYSLGAGQNVNNSSSTYVGWSWKAGTSFTNDASATGIGSIDSTGSFNNDSGFSIVSYTGNNTSGATLKHGLNTAPAMVIVKNRNRTDNRDWVVYHQKLTSASYYIYLNSTGAMAGAYANFWNNTAPNSSVITLGSGDTTTNGNGDTYIAYCFAEKQGYSKVGGSYTGNGSTDGTFVYTGFKPAFVMTKITSGADSWTLWDNKRDVDNVATSMLRADTNQAEDTSSSYLVDFLSNGFKWRSSDGKQNGSGSTYIYMAFAENPFVSSTGVPATAR